MGTDIYCAIERRDSSGRWRFVGPLDIRRSYALFGALAGVGGTGHKPLAPPRGLPEDLDLASCTDDEHGECFGGADEFGERDRSWLTLAELRSYDWSTIFTGEGQANQSSACMKFVEWIAQQDAPPNDLRIVFGFDH